MPTPSAALILWNQPPVCTCWCRTWQYLFGDFKGVRSCLPGNGDKGQICVFHNITTTKRIKTHFCNFFWLIAESQSYLEKLCWPWTLCERAHSVSEKGLPLDLHSVLTAGVWEAGRGSRVDSLRLLSSGKGKHRFPKQQEGQVCFLGASLIFLLLAAGWPGVGAVVWFRRWAHMLSAPEEKHTVVGMSVTEHLLKAVKWKTNEE